MTTAEIEYAVAVKIGIGNRLIVPNVKWGMGFPFECDLLYLTDSNYAHEIEIKASKSDILRDKQKNRHTYEPYMLQTPIIRTKTFAIPIEMEACIQYIPSECGVLMVTNTFRTDGNRFVSVVRKAKVNNRARKLTDEERQNMYRLMAMRVWAMKKKMLREAR